MEEQVYAGQPAAPLWVPEQDEDARCSPCTRDRIHACGRCVQHIASAHVHTPRPSLHLHKDKITKNPKMGCSKPNRLLQAGVDVTPRGAHPRAQ